MKKLLFTVAMTMCVVQATMAHTSFGERPKLVVGIVVDQMRWVQLRQLSDQLSAYHHGHRSYEYLYRYYTGFARYLW